MGRSPDKAEQIAAGLTEAQREGLLSCREKADPFGRSYLHEGTRKALFRRGLTMGGMRLTPLGLAVRDILTRENQS